MLKEVPSVRQIEGEGRRRWFTDEYFDLIVWYDRGRIQGFQLCYDKGGRERALTWRGEGFTHHAVDTGEDDRRGFKATPILVADGLLDRDDLAERFRQSGQALEPGLTAWILEKIKVSD
jgi:hypothetical protein